MGKHSKTKVVEEDFDSVLEEFSQNPPTVVSGKGQDRSSGHIQAGITAGDVSNATLFAVLGVVVTAYLQFRIHHLVAAQELLILLVAAAVAAYLLVVATTAVAKRRFGATVVRTRGFGNPSGESTWYSISLNLIAFLLASTFLHAYAVPNLLNHIQIRELTESPYIDAIPSLILPAIVLAYQAKAPRFVF